MSVNIAIKYAILPHGLKYFYQHWILSNPKALVVFVHDLGDHIGRYGEFISRLTQSGFACALFDQCGHGRSEGKRGHVESFSDWVNDLSSFVQFSQMAVLVETPLFIIGMGLGGLVGINFLLSHTTHVSGMVTLSATISPTLRLPSWKKKLIKKFGRLIPEKTIHSGIQISDLTRDEKELELLKKDNFYHDRLTLNAMLEIKRNLELVMAMPHRIHLPMFMIAGGDDTICDPDGTRQFAMRLSTPDKKYHICPGSMHDLLHDTSRVDVMDDIVLWIEKQIENIKPADKQIGLNRRETIWEDVSRLPV